MNLTKIHENLQFLRDVLHSENPNKIEYCKAAVDDTIHELELLCATRLDLSNETFEFRESTFSKPTKVKGRDLEKMEKQLNNIYCPDHSSTAHVLTERLEEAYTKKLLELATVNWGGCEPVLTLAGRSITVRVTQQDLQPEVMLELGSFIAESTHFYSNIEKEADRRRLLWLLAFEIIYELGQELERKQGQRR